MAKDISEAVREACLWLPDAEEFISHGSPNFRTRGGRIYATYVINHHGDGNVALWIAGADGAQAQRVRAEPKHFYVPPYVGPYGWIGVRLDSGLGWDRIVELVLESYKLKAKAKQIAQIGKPPKIAAPKQGPALADVDPMRTPRALQVLKAVRAIVEDWPEVSEDKQFGTPVWRCGKRVFLHAYSRERLTLAFWVGIGQQSLMTADPRFTIPPYLGHNGWIALDVSRNLDRNEVRALAFDSYRHFALKRMLAQMGEG